MSARERLFWAPVRQHDDPVWELDLRTGRTSSVPVVGRLPSRWGSEAEAAAAVQKSALSADWFLSSDGRHLCVTRRFHISGSGRTAVGCPIAVGATHGIGAAPRALARLDGVVRALPAPLAALFDPETGVTELVRTRDGRHVAAVERDVPKGELVVRILDAAALREVRSVRVPFDVGQSGSLTLGDGPSEYRLGAGGGVAIEAATGIATPAPRPASIARRVELCVAGHLALPRRACTAD
ncbi:MAG: hypothetical protein HY908_07530 [Myxococcales bacterium]|nr:hypothetical protein [Myxococcales bacterium]